MASAAVAGFARVGELACQKNSFLRELVATVVSCEPAKVPEGKKKHADANAAVPLFDLVLSDSVLFPEGGGQPCDHGKLFVLSSVDNKAEGKETRESEPIAITNVQRKGDTCVLSSPVCLAPGTVVSEVVDWERRLDHMQHHTAQHLLTAVVERPDMMLLPTASWSLTHPFCFIQLDLSEHLANPESPYTKFITKEKKIADDMLQRIQNACNEAIANRTAVRCDVFDTREAYQAEQDRRQAEQRKLREEAGEDEASCFRSRGIPADVSGPIRIITLDGIDSCTCCGTHLHTLAELQAVFLLHQEIKNATVKLFFVTGQRAVKAFGDMYSREKQLMVSLGGCRPEDFADSIQRRAKDASDNEKKLKRWALELASFEAEKLIRQCNSGGAQKRVLAIRRDDVEIEFFNAVRTALNDAGLSDTVLVAAWATEGGTAAASNSIVPTKDVQGQVFITGASKEALETVAAKAKEVMTEMKGGLSKMGFRGKGSLREWARLAEELQSLEF